MAFLRPLLLALLLAAATAAHATRVGTLTITSAAMHKTCSAAVVLPASYAKGKGLITRRFTCCTESSSIFPTGAV